MPDDPNGSDETSGGSTDKTGGGTKTGEFPAWVEPQVEEVKAPENEDLRGGTKSGEYGG